MNGPLELPNLENESVRLRAFRDSDAALIQAASTDPLIPLITTVPSDDSAEAALAFIARQHDRLASRTGYSFAIADIHTDQAAGQIGLWPRAVDPGRASIGYWVEATHRMSGYASAALTLLVSWAFNRAAMQRLELAAEPWNEASWHLAESAGFQREGLMRGWQKVGNERKDMFLYALLPPDLGSM